MSSIWEFVKRHRGKILASGAFVGSIYTAKKVYDSEYVKEYIQSPSHQEHEAQLSQARRHFIFDAHQQSCDKNLVESISDIKAILKSRYPVEILVESLKDSDEISNEQKIQIWEDIKHKSISRIVSTSVALSIIIIATKIQKSILCSEMCKIVEETRQKQTSMTTHGIKNYISSFIWGNDDKVKPEYGTQFANPKVQQVFVNCIQFLTTSGLNQIFTKIESITEECLNNFSLTKKITVSEFEILIHQILDKFEKEAGAKNYCDYIVPVTNVRVNKV
uniref:Peroxisomal biogenesis factor 3 n=1 Tax=Panagrolaimus superbus TaxID=310955 RepID=A0A914ZB43_9BILA